MAEKEHPITVQNELRPCVIWDGKSIFSDEKPALFHRWIEDGKACPNNPTRALVEFANGRIEKVLPRQVRFLDSETKFAEFGLKAVNDYDDKS